MAHQRNRGILAQSGFLGSFDAPWSEWSWIINFIILYLRKKVDSHAVTLKSVSLIYLFFALFSLFRCCKETPSEAKIQQVSLIILSRTSTVSGASVRTTEISWIQGQAKDCRATAIDWSPGIKLVHLICVYTQPMQCVGLLFVEFAFCNFSVAKHLITLTTIKLFDTLIDRASPWWRSNCCARRRCPDFPQPDQKCNGTCTSTKANCCGFSP